MTPKAGRSAATEGQAAAVTGGAGGIGAETVALLRAVDEGRVPRPRR